MNRVTRRSFLRSAGTAAGLAWLPVFRVHADTDQGCPAPAGFPAEIELYRQAYRNWAGDIVADDVWTCAPRRAEDIPVLADWAVASSHRLRAQGKRHTRQDPGQTS